MQCRSPIGLQFARHGEYLYNATCYLSGTIENYFTWNNKLNQYSCILQTENWDCAKLVNLKKYTRKRLVIISSNVMCIEPWTIITFDTSMTVSSLILEVAFDNAHKNLSPFYIGILLHLVYGCKCSRRDTNRAQPPTRRSSDQLSTSPPFFF